MKKGGKDNLTNKDVKNIKKKAEDALFGMKNKNKSKHTEKYLLLN